MSEAPYLGQSTDVILGQEFLTWLWYQSDTAPGSFKDREGQPFFISMEQRVVVQGGEGETKETASVSGAMSPLKEARLGLATGKKVSRGLIRVEKDEMSWQFTFKSEDFSLNSLKSPKVEKDSEDVDGDGMLLEKIYLIEVCIALLDDVYKQFLKLRLSDAWHKEVVVIRSWMLK